MPPYISSPNHSKGSPSNSTREHISWPSAPHLSLLCSLFLLPYNSSHDSLPTPSDSRAICHTLQSRLIPLLATSLWTTLPPQTPTACPTVSMLVLPPRKCILEQLPTYINILLHKSWGCPLSTKQNNQANFIGKIYIIWYNGNNSEMKTDSVTVKDRHVINSSHLIDIKYQNIWGVIGQLILGSYTILWLNIYYPKLSL